MSLITVTVDGQSRSIESDQRPTHIFAENKDVVVCRINGQLKDLWTDLVDGDVIEAVTISSPDGLAVLRHSTAHVMAQAVQQVFADTKLGIGPPITDGFYYDFDPQSPFNRYATIGITGWCVAHFTHTGVPCTGVIPTVGGFPREFRSYLDHLDSQLRIKSF